jgi:general secretion pathway protein G
MNRERRGIRAPARRHGFTLIEIMVVVIILTILAGAVVTLVTGRTDDARVARARSDVANLETALEQFKLDMMRYPTSEEGLAVLREQPQSEDTHRWKGPYLRKPVPLDPWGNVYRYVSPGVENPESYDLESYGADGQDGGEGYARDIESWTNYDEAEPVGG